MGSGEGDEDEGQDVNDLESVVKRAADQGNLTLYCTYPVTTFLCMSVHHNNKQHNGGLQFVLLREIWLSCFDKVFAYQGIRRIDER